MCTHFIKYTIVPIVSFVVLLSIQIVAPRMAPWLYSELGVLELTTAVLFFLTGMGAALLVWKCKGFVPWYYRFFFLIFAGAAFFVSLEEISYGQHFLGFVSPEWFAANNTRHETNLHNLRGDALSDLLRGLAEVLFPVCGIGLPVVYSRRTDAYKPGHWTYYCLPRSELITLIVIAQSIMVVDRLAKASLRWIIPSHGEVKEMYWSIAAAVYIQIIWNRLISERD
jgi:hypothetical protein